MKARPRLLPGLSGVSSPLARILAGTTTNNITGKLTQGINALVADIILGSAGRSQVNIRPRTADLIVEAIPYLDYSQLNTQDLGFLGRRLQSVDNLSAYGHYISAVASAHSSTPAPDSSIGQDLRIAACNAVLYRRMSFHLGQATAANSPFASHLRQALNQIPAPDDGTMDAEG